MRINLILCSYARKRLSNFLRPDAFGEFLFLLIISFPFLKNFSNKSLVLSIILTILAFFTKPYYIIALPYLLTYLFLFISKKKAVIMGIIAATVSGIILFAVYKLSPIYLNDVISINSNSAVNEISWAIKQFIEFTLFNLPLIILLVSAAIFLMMKKRGFIKLKLNSFRQIKVKEFFNLKKLDSPLFFYSKNYIFIFCSAISTLIIFFKLGRHTGAYMTYLYQLISPFFLIFIFQVIKLIEDNLKMKRLAMILIGINLVLVLTFHFVHLYLLHHDIERQGINTSKN